MKKEIWLPIKKFENQYLISNKGNVWSLYSYRKLKQRVGKAGYAYVVLSKNGKHLTKKVHRLVAEAFCSNPNNFNVVNHKDENKLNNKASNLEWCTEKYNVNYGTNKSRILNTKINNGNTRRIVAVNIDTRDKEYFDTRHECARKLGICPQSIRQYLNDKSLRRCKRYIFIDQSKYNKKLEDKLIKRALSPKNSPKKVTVFTDNGVKHFNTILASSRFMKASPGHVFNALKRGKKVKGYRVVKGWV